MRIKPSSQQKNIGGFSQNISGLEKTVDVVSLKRRAHLKEELEFMKADLNRVKAILREKLGVVIP